MKKSAPIVYHLGGSNQKTICGRKFGGGIEVVWIPIKSNCKSCMNTYKLQMAMKEVKEHERATVQRED